MDECEVVYVKTLSVRRKFKNDVPTALTKAAPEFCTAYVISKGEVATVRSVNRPLPNTATPTKQPFLVGLPPSHQDQDESIKTPFARGRNPLPSRRSTNRGSNDFLRTPPRERPKNASNNIFLGEYDLISSSTRSSRTRESMSDDIDFTGSVRFGSFDISSESLDLNLYESPRISTSSTRGAEAEMKRLKLELKQTMDMYNLQHPPLLHMEDQAFPSIVVAIYRDKSS